MTSERPAIEIGYKLTQDLALPAHFEKAARMQTEDRVAEAV